MKYVITALILLPLAFLAIRWLAARICDFAAEDKRDYDYAHDEPWGRVPDDEGGCK